MKTREVSKEESLQGISPWSRSVRYGRCWSKAHKPVIFRFVVTGRQSVFKIANLSANVPCPRCGSILRQTTVANVRNIPISGLVLESL